MLKRIFIAIFLVSIILVGCQTAVPQEKEPEIPETIKQGENQAPVLTLYNAETGQKTTIDIEEYIKGVVAAEMDTSWPEEALKAQAILARTFTLQKISENGGVPERGAHASTDIEEFQAYDTSKINDNVKQAVEATRGQVVAYQGDYIRAWFHAYSGGKTATAEEGLAFDKYPTPYIQVVDDPGIDSAPAKDKEWSVTLSKSTIREKIEAYSGQQVPDFSEITIVESGPSGRATKLKLGETVISAPLFRLSLGSTEVKSTYFTDMQVQEDKVTMTGTGYGHGVGMSQWGAKAMADSGKKAEEIVTYFFKDLKLYTLWQ